MKLKQQPEDFQVEELTDVVPSEGPFALYRLTKTGWTTTDALAAVRQRWGLDRNQVSFGGLKDRHAHTVQYLTILRGPQRKLTHDTIRVEYLGQVAEPFTSRDIRANRFRLTLRDLTAEAIHAAQAALDEVCRDGVPNYFDDQRFGSVNAGGDFFARALVQGRYEDALRLALAAPSTHDRAAAKKEKATLRACWGDWAACQQRLPRGPARTLVDYLAHHPGDFRGALERLNPDLRGLYLSAYQSHLWNRMLARWLREHLRPEQLVPVHLRLGEVPMHRNLDEMQRSTLASLHLPLPSGRVEYDPADPGEALVDAILAEEGVSREQLKLKGFRRLFFSRGERAALCLPRDLRHEVGADELHRGRSRLALAFELPRGAYATLLVKRVTAVPRATGRDPLAGGGAHD
ncbi:MAG: tRNA pseudouridine(13) synthase TruD [Gemmataceae bacterium]|nr:tRNA pseudouridine(13) synthase TruD [Gemmataceae bacterium]